MVLNGKNGGFFLDLDSSDAAPVTLDLGPDKEPEEAAPEEASPMTLTVARAEGSTAPAPADTKTPVSQPPAATATPAAAKAAPPAKPSTPKPSLTTAEAIAAELAATEADRPAVSLSTFAPDNLLPGTGLRQRRRRPGSNLKGFKDMAGDLFKS
ncbi:MAG: hypothetical protein ACPG6X_01540 [Synechococcus sp.]